ncbi:MAG TPA: hypothetical protein VK179_00005 [Bacteroidales bacterium]|nr:hypothetical protein [Bacteroidales bacterium]
MKTTFTYRNNRKLAIAVLAFGLFLSNSCEVANDVLGNETVAAIEGEWGVEEESQFYKKSTMIPNTYSVFITIDPDNPNGVIIDGFYHVNISIKASVSGSTITILEQSAHDENTQYDYTVSGSGSLTGNLKEISWNYVVNDGSTVSDHCTATYTKK